MVPICHCNHPGGVSFISCCVHDFVRNVEKCVAHDHLVSLVCSFLSVVMCFQYYMKGVFCYMSNYLAFPWSVLRRILSRNQISSLVDIQRRRSTVFKFPRTRNIPVNQRETSYYYAQLPKTTEVTLYC